MREVRDVLRRRMASDAKLGDSLDHLQDDEEADHDERGQLYDGDEYPEEHERRDARGRVHHQVRAQHAGDGARGADHRRRCDESLPDGGDDTAEEVEEQERQTAEGVFDVIAEDPEVQHVPEHVQPAAVQELMRDEGHERGQRGVAR